MTFLFHAPLTDFPIVLFLVSVFFDVLYLVRRQPVYRSVAFWLLGLGVLSVPFVIAAGFADYVQLVNQGVGTAFVMRHQGHSTFAYGASLLFAVSLLLRWRRPTAVWPAFVVSLVGAGLIIVAGFLGGQLRGVM